MALPTDRVYDGRDATDVILGTNGGKSKHICLFFYGGAACTIVSHPDDVIKTRMQTHLRGSPHFGTYAGYWNTGKGATWEGGIHEAG